MSKANGANTFIQRVSTPSRAYDVHVGTGLLDEVGAITRQSCGGGHACVISETNVAPRYLERALASLRAAGYEASSQVFAAGEPSKCLSTLGELLEGLAEHGLDRDDVVVALGGGVTGDIAGLAAAMYLRGCRVVQVPTSLLAMVDSSVGGKVAVDLEHGKNLAGFFWQPSAVVADVECLHTLEHQKLTDSIGEVVKHAVLADPDLLDEITRRPLNAGGYPDDEMARVVSRNVAIKRDVVDADEREQGTRQTLNLGHTIGHAIEAASGFALGHGSCVAAGLCCVARASAAKGWCSEDTCGRILAAVEAHGLPTGTDVDPDVLLGYMAHDKKRHADAVNLVVPARIGHVEIRRTGMGELRELLELGCGKRG